MPQTTSSNAKQENTDFIDENTKTGSSEIEKPQKGKGIRFLDSIVESGSFIKQALKSTAIGVAAGFAFSLLFPPLGIAIMAISAIAGVAAIGTKVAYSYAKTKAENSSPKESTETKAEILREITRTLMEEKLSKNKEEIKQQEKKNGIKNGEADNSRELRKSVINTNESGLAVFTKPLNSLNPDIKQNATASKSKTQQKETQSAQKNTGMRRNTL
ncbi:hypothetical protein WH221_05835 [Chryseobacterium culicis]|uniref:Uncharacterized protein n=1 Tax=Chryseobacterium culicis TaxID=680127 RepID=A0A2S9CZ21_CHRCI|nr:hypothetical protein [Chryseobacterium culicis]PRB85767.1 hypothetical protein CQ022_05795 [Chryseobacterium culicis]PRB90509.1 hypothetical protein CQ033_07190 [Chryseobacterium culicis]